MLTAHPPATPAGESVPLGNQVRYAVKAGIAGLLYTLGLLQLWQKLVLRRRAVVLMYHRVLSPAERAGAASHPGIVVDRDTFARHMSLLKRRFTVLSVEEFARHIEQRIPFPNSACLITFDDGWRDTFVNARPILQAHGLPAVVFLPVNFIDSARVFWQEALTRLLERAVVEARGSAARRRSLEAILAGWDLAGVLALTGEDVRSRISEVVGRQKEVPRRDVDDLIAALAAELHVDPTQFSASDGFMGWEDAVEMTRCGVAFGGHGAEHYLLTAIPRAEAELDLRTAKATLTRRLPDSVAAFSYPNGSWAPEVAAMARQAGYDLAFTTRPGRVACDDDALSLRRINIHQDVTDSPALFLARVVGLF